MRRFSVRTRTTVTASVVFAVALAASAVVLLQVLRSSLLDEIDRSIDARAADIAAQIDVGNELISVGAGLDATTLAIVFSIDGGVYDSSDLSLDATALVDAFGAFDEPFDLDLGVLDATEGADNLRAVALLTDESPLSPPGELVEVGEEDLITVVATSLDGVDRTVSRVRTLAVIVGPALVGLVALLTWLLSGRALRPVEAMRREAEAISGADVSGRVPEPSGRDEVARLASTLNGMLDRIEHAQQRQRQFVSDASHELRSPLASMRARLDVELRHPEPEWERVGESLRDDAARMHRLVDDLLLLARSDDRGLSTGSDLVDLDDVVLDVVAATPHAGVTVDVSSVSGALTSGDADQLRRVVQNLFDNAVRHAGSKVRIELAEVDGRCRLFVDDDGSGIADADRDLVFERFSRLDDARDRDSGGSGLGLAITREIVIAHRGRIGVGESVLGGARFGVELPGVES